MAFLGKDVRDIAEIRHLTCTEMVRRRTSRGQLPVIAASCAEESGVFTLHRGVCSAGLGWR